jgi:hypothetical protein
MQSKKMSPNSSLAYNDVASAEIILAEDVDTTITPSARKVVGSQGVSLDASVNNELKVNLYSSLANLSSHNTSGLLDYDPTNISWSSKTLESSDSVVIDNATDSSKFTFSTPAKSTVQKVAVDESGTEKEAVSLKFDNGSNGNVTFTTTVDAQGTANISASAASDPSVIDVKVGGGAPTSTHTLNFNSTPSIYFYKQVDPVDNTVTITAQGSTAMSLARDQFVLLNQAKESSVVPNACDLSKFESGLLKNTVTSGTAALSRAVPSTVDQAGDYVGGSTSLAQMASIPKNNAALMGVKQGQWAAIEPEAPQTSAVVIYDAANGPVKYLHPDDATKINYLGWDTTTQRPKWISEGPAPADSPVLSSGYVGAPSGSSTDKQIHPISHSWWQWRNGYADFVIMDATIQAPTDDGTSLIMPTLVMAQIFNHGTATWATTATISITEISQGQAKGVLNYTTTGTTPPNNFGLFYQVMKNISGLTPIQFKR